MSVLLRIARPSDAPGIARVEVEAWRDTYPTLIPSRYLVHGLDLGRRTRLWRRRLSQRRGETVIGAFDSSTDAAGYAAFGPSRSRALPFEGELYELYLLPEAQGRGLGRCLCAAAAEGLLKAGMSSMCVEVLEGNVSRFFYEALGGRLAARKRHPFAGKRLPTLVYAWNDLTALVGQGAT